MIEQRSPEWFKMREGKITGSNVGAILGLLTKYRTRQDVMNEMIAKALGMKTESHYTAAMQYGIENEPTALGAYTYIDKPDDVKDNTIKEATFVIHPNHPWLGASPDALVGDDGLLEIKCPYGARHNNKFTSITHSSKEHYYAQMQIQMSCTQRNWCDFYQWSPNSFMLERVEHNPKWVADALPILKEFYEEYLDKVKYSFLDAEGRILVRSSADDDDFFGEGGYVDYYMNQS